MKKSKKWSLALVLALLLLAGGCGQEETVQEEESDESAVAVEIQRVERSSIAAESTVSGPAASRAAFTSAAISSGRASPAASSKVIRHAPAVKAALMAARA